MTTPANPDDLITWLRAQLDDDERVARAADSSRWLPEDKGITFEYIADDFHEGEAQARLVADTRANQEHIACHDPARVLAEVDAKRRILDEHPPIPEPYGLAGHCERCVDPEAGGPDPAAVYPCTTVRLLALPFAARDGYRSEWAPA